MNIVYALSRENIYLSLNSSLRPPVELIALYVAVVSYVSGCFHQIYYFFF